jgi:hypothetical protein
MFKRFGLGIVNSFCFEISYRSGFNPVLPLIDGGLRLLFKVSCVSIVEAISESASRCTRQKIRGEEQHSSPLETLVA